MYHNVQVRVTNFSTTGGSPTYIQLSEESLCNSTRTGFTTLSMTVAGQNFSIGLQYESEARIDQTVKSGSGLPLGDVVVYFGGLPSK